MDTQDGSGTVDRRGFLGMAAKGALGATAIGLLACQNQAAPGADGTSTELTEAAAGDESLPEIEWEMPTSWPAALDTIYGGATTFADRVNSLSGGRFVVTAREGGEIAPPLEVLQTVQSGGAQAGHTASYYYTGLSPVTAFGTALPFGLNDRQQNAWLYYGGGLEMLQEFYASEFNVIQFPAGNTGTQMGGWFNSEINGVSDLSGLRMRIPGQGGAVMERLGVSVQVLPGAEIFQALQTGAVDAAEWVGPYDDLKLDFQSVAQFYYYPGWWEPGPTLEVQVALDQWNELPSLYQDIVRTAAYEANVTMMARYDAQNPAAFAEILDNSEVTVLPFPDEVMEAAQTEAFALYDETAAADPAYGEILTEWTTFRDQINTWFGVAERAMIDFVAPAPGAS